MLFNEEMKLYSSDGSKMDNYVLFWLQTCHATLNEVSGM